jgi:Zn-dependent protease with chaperone function
VNFFENQDHARRQTRWLVVLFVFAVIAIVVAIDFALLLAFGLANLDQEVSVLSIHGLKSNLPLLTGGAVVSGSVIGLASLFKTASLRGGGGKVARDLGGTLVDADARDPLRRRLRNVVEEIALASGVPVPEIYVLEQESGINAFAAGFTPSDAAVAVTRGAMEKLSRSELQGVIAHEFSHIFNGDMRLNIRLMGSLFGILVLALIGRRVLYSSRYMGRSSRDNSGAPIIIIAIVLTLVGYIGLFFGRWIKSAVSRQREYLADASAVQFTRDPDGISGALKKIAIYGDASYLNVESEEVGHMLFGSGQKMNLFATHPPLTQRIQRIDPSFREEELLTISKKIRREESREAKKQVARAAKEEKAGSGSGGMIFDAGRFMEQIGNPQWERLIMAATVAASIPEAVKTAAHSADWAPEVLFYTLLDSHPEIREQQMLIIAQRMGSDSDVRVRGLVGAAEQLQPEQRLPLMEVALPSLKRHPPEVVQKILETVNELIHADGRIDVFEYLLARVVSQYLWEAMNPQAVRNSGRKKLVSLGNEASMVLAILARHGHQSDGQAQQAFEKGLSHLKVIDKTDMPETVDWIESLDDALAKLNNLRIADKEILVRALIETVTADGKLVTEEMELSRAVCALIHVPLPIIPASQP